VDQIPQRAGELHRRIKAVRFGQERLNMTDPAQAAPAWPKSITEWHDNGTGHLSVPFTWLLPDARRRVRQGDAFVSRWVVGGPAIRLMPDYDLSPATIMWHVPGVLQRVNPRATRTTTGCPRCCAFCGVRRIEPQYAELNDWPDRPIVCDNNLLAASERHVGRVCERLEQWGWADFNQGLDARLLTTEHAAMIARIRKPICRLALDSDGDREAWLSAVDRLRSAGIAKRNIRSYVLCGFAGTPEADWARCKWVESRGVMALPMWYHLLDAMKPNIVTPEQEAMGWTNRKRRELMCWFFQHRTLEVRG
jgi:hypothetical protein